MVANHVGVGSDNANSSGRISGWESAAQDAGVELSPGLSLNGRFGVDPSKDGPQITRSSSISVFPPFSTDNINQLPAPAVAVPERAHSLPTETQAEKWRKRKELKSLRHSEARKRRMDKMITRAQTSIPIPTPAPALGNGAPLRTQKSESLPIKVTAAMIANADEAAGGPQPAQGTNEPPPRRRIPRPRADSIATEKKAADARQTLTNMMMEMPSVTTLGIEPNGRKVDGLLYRYTRGEEVKILCVFHGSFMAKFVLVFTGVLQPLEC